MALKRMYDGNIQTYVTTIVYDAVREENEKKEAEDTAIKLLSNWITDGWCSFKTTIE